MKHTTVRTVFVTLVAFFAISGIAWAAQLRQITSRLGGSTGDYFDLNGTLLVDSIKIGSQGVGGVTYFNGTIANLTTTSGVDNPVTFGDNVRVDGSFWRGSASGPGDNYPLKLNDDVRVFGDLTIDSGKTITVSGVNWTGVSWNASQIADTTRQLQLPLTSFLTDANGSPAALSGSTQPNLLFIANQGLFLEYSEDDTVDIGTQFVIPEDYASAGVIKAVVDTSGTIVSNWDLDFTFGVSGIAANVGTWDSDTDDETAVDITGAAGTPRVLTFTPKDQSLITAGDTIFFDVFPANNTASGEPNVEIYNVWFEYTAAQ